jgi:PAS domain S-box-containing protein
MSLRGKQLTDETFDKLDEDQVSPFLSVELFKLMFEAVTDGIVIADLNGKIVQVNQSNVQLHGYSVKEEMLGHLELDFTAERDRAGAAAHLKKIMEGDCLAAVEHTHLRKDGTEFETEITTALLKDPYGMPLGTLAIIKDTTESKRSEKDKQALQSHLEFQVDRMPLALIIFDMNFRIKSWNPAAARTFGFSPGEALGRHPYELIVPKSAQIDIDQTWACLIKGEETAPHINENITKEGRIITCEWFNTPLKDDAGRVIGVLSMAEDITRQKQHQEKLARSSQEWRITFDSISEMVSITDTDYRILRLNKAFGKAVNKKPEEIVGEKCFEVMHGTSTPPADCPLARTIKSCKPSILEFNDTQRDIYFEESTSPVLDENGKVRAIVLVARDITHRKKMEEQLVVADRLASIGELVAGVAHELNNPLTSVIGFSEILVNEGNPDVIKEELGIINREANRTFSIVKNLLTFARKHEPIKQLCSINRALAEVLNLREYEQKVNNIQIVKLFSPDLPEIMIDYFQMQQVFLNLIVNAEQAMLEAHGCGILTITTENLKNSIKITFADDGPGIAPENMPKIFNPFFTTKGVGRGTGLGLSICHGIITSHGGNISAQTQFGKGSKFIIELPLYGADKA